MLPVDAFVAWSTVVTLIHRFATWGSSQALAVLLSPARPSMSHMPARGANSR